MAMSLPLLRFFPPPALLLLVLGLCGGTRAVNVKPPQVAVLRECFDAWGRPDSLSGWAPPWNCSAVFGVYCDDTGDISGFSLPATGVTGPIPSSIGKLSALTDLDLSQNSLTGPIPPSIGSLTSLVFLLLNNNSLTGRIPPNIGNLIGLIELDLSDNSLTGPITPSIGNLKGLSFLNLGQNSLTGPIPPSIGNLKGLHSLILNQNSLTGPIPPSIGSLKSLNGLILTNNSLTGPIPSSIGNLTYLLVVSLSNNSLTGSIPPSFGNLTLLQELQLNDNLLTGPIPNLHGYVFANNNYLSSISPGQFKPPCTSVLFIDTNCFVNPTLQQGTLCGISGKQRSVSECSAFCDAGSPSGYCSGHGVCSSKHGSVSRYCQCDGGYMPLWFNPNSCVPSKTPTPGLIGGFCKPSKPLSAPQTLACKTSVPLGGQCNCPARSRCQRKSWCCSRFTCICLGQWPRAVYNSDETKLIKCY